MHVMHMLCTVPVRSPSHLASGVPHSPPGGGHGALLERQPNRAHGQPAAAGEADFLPAQRAKRLGSFQLRHALRVHGQTPLQVGSRTALKSKHWSPCNQQLLLLLSVLAWACGAVCGLAPLIRFTVPACLSLQCVSF